VVEPGCGMLTERQMTWVDEFPHESTTENPVLYKYVFILQNLQIMFIVISSVFSTSAPQLLAVTTELGRYC